MTGIKFITEPDETGLGRIVVDGKFYGLPSGAVAALARSFTAHDIAPIEAIGNLLAQAMNQAVANGANSVSMPDEYVEIAAWLAAGTKQKESE